MKPGNYLLPFGFIVIIFSLGTITFLQQDKPESYFENRTLAQKPKFNLQDAFEGDLFKRYDQYFTDQFVGRDAWVKNYTKWELFSNKTYVNGYHVTSDEVILEKPKTYEKKQEFVKSANALNEFGDFLKKQNTSLFYVPAPAKVNHTTSFLPKYVPKGNGKENTNFLVSKLDDNLVKTIPIANQMDNIYTDEEMLDFYFKTDHHWNIKGAFKGYQLMIEGLGKYYRNIPTDYSSDQYEYTIDHDMDFIGSYNLSLYMLINSKQDHPNYYYPKNYSFNDFNIYRGPITEKNLIKDVGNIYASGYNKKLKEINFGRAYTFNYDELNIVNAESQNKLRVLLLKDSYANPIIFHTAHHFQTTTVYDIRYNEDRSVYDYLKQNKFDIVIVFYNTNNLTGPMYQFS